MHRTEESEHDLCLVCGADVVAAVERGYVASDEDVVCFECAVRLGGVWDEETGRWTRPPNLAGVTREREGAPA